MTLKEHIDDIRNNLEEGLFTSEAAVSNGIVRRLLDALDWPIYNPQIIIPEYSVEGRRVDFALCHPSSKPLVFIEVKQVGNIEGAERQLFEYAFHEGVPIAILTDGQKWRFFYPIGQGDYRERKVHEMDLAEGDSEESAKRLERYLNYESICTSDAIKAIEEDYRNVSRQRQVATRLPEAWSKLVEEADEFLLDVVGEKVESLCGYRPTDGQVLDFLKSLGRVEAYEQAIHFSLAKTDASKHSHKGYVKEDGSAEWTTRGKRRVISATIVAEMQNAYHASVERGDGAVKYPMQVLVKHGIVEDTNYDKDGNWNAVAKIVGHERKTKSYSRKVPPSLASEVSSTFLNQKSPTQSKAPQTRLVVTMPDGEVIEQYSGIETFVEVIEKLMRRYGEDVILRAAGGRPIISTSSFNYPGKRDKRLGRFYISTNHSAKAKKVHLNYIAERLGVQLKVEIVDKQ